MLECQKCQQQIKLVYQWSLTCHIQLKKSGPSVLNNLAHFDMRNYAKHVAKHLSITRKLLSRAFFRFSWYINLLNGIRYQ